MTQNFSKWYIPSVLIIPFLISCGGGGTSQAPVPTPPPATGSPVLSRNPVSLASGLALGQSNWPTGSTSMGGQGAAIEGVTCLINENYHLHAHLSIFRDGTRLAIPANVGLQGCTYELHTHDATGILHVETHMEKTFTLGQFFSVWGRPLTSENIAGIAGLPVRFYVVDGDVLTTYLGDPREIELKAHRSITIVIGSRIEEIPSYSWHGGL